MGRKTTIYNSFADRYEVHMQEVDYFERLVLAFILGMCAGVAFVSWGIL